MAVFTVSVSVALWLSNRSYKRQNVELRNSLAELAEATPAAVDNDPSAWITERLNELDTEDPLTPLVSCVLNQQVSPEESFSDSLQALIGQVATSGEDSESDGESLALLQQELADTKAELEALGAQQSQGDEDGGSATPEELKTLLQQFTKDSREMMICIQALEQENAELKAELEKAATTPTPAGEAAEPENSDSDTNLADLADVFDVDESSSPEPDTGAAA